MYKPHAQQHNKNWSKAEQEEIHIYQNVTELHGGFQEVLGFELA